MIKEGEYIIENDKYVAGIDYDPKGKSTMVIAEKKDNVLIIKEVTTNE